MTFDPENPPEQPGSCCITHYDDTGRITALSFVQEEVVGMMLHAGHKLVKGWHDEASAYISGNRPHKRPANPARLDGMTLRDLPVPCVVDIDGTAYSCETPSVELDLPYSKTYAVKVLAFPMQDAAFEVTKP